MYIFAIGIRINFADMLVIVCDFQWSTGIIFQDIKNCILLHLVSWLYLLISVTQSVK